MNSLLLRCGLAIALTCSLPIEVLAQTQSDPPQQVSVEGSPTTNTQNHCDDNWAASVYHAARSSIARIESGGTFGTGFFFHSNRHLATAFHVVSLGREVYVTLSNGQRRQADVVAVDREHDNAILELHQPSDGANLLLPPESNELPAGTEVVAIGHPNASRIRPDMFQGLLDYSVSRGIISASNSHYLQTDAAINPGNSGGPILNCHGRILGTAVARWSGGEGVSAATRVTRLQDLVRQIGVQSRYRGGWRVTNLSASLATQLSLQEAWIGFGVGAGLVGYDRLAISLRTSVLFFLDPNGTMFYRTEAMRLLGELGISYRFLLFAETAPIYITLGLSGAVGYTAYDRVSTTVTQQDPMCVSSPTNLCALRVNDVRAKSDSIYGWPSVDFAFRVALFETAYSFQLDVIRPERSFHRLLVGLSF